MRGAVADSGTLAFRPRAVAGWWALVFLAGCGGGSPSGPTSTPIPFTSHSSPHFTFRYTQIDAASVAATAEEVEAQRGPILGDLGLGEMPAVTVTLYPDRESFRAAVVPLVGSVPSFASGLVNGPSEIHVLSPNLASQWSYANGLVAIVHEFAHCVSLRVNPAIANNPRWLWEAVALYEAGQIVDPGSLPYLRAHQPPTLADLDRIENTAIYEVGGVIAEFIVETWGRGALRALVVAGGSLETVLGLDETEFVALWFDYVRRRYGI
ncbi:MAG TPA: hypothetical protein VFM88_10430 [Vicinamibacteria bacterium]|nr:hypothetical protein [Vicinamibacteria bacterium]